MLKSKDPRGDLGKWAEKQVRAWLEGRSAAEAGFAFHRFPDSRAARGTIPNQPSDFLVGRRISPERKYVVFLEVKETAEKNRLPKSKVSQFGMLLKWHLAGSYALVVVYRSLYDDWTYFGHKELFTDLELRSFPWVEGRSFPTEADLLNYVFK